MLAVMENILVQSILLSVLCTSFCFQLRLVQGVQPTKSQHKGIENLYERHACVPSRQVKVNSTLDVSAVVAAAYRSITEVGAKLILRVQDTNSLDQNNLTCPHTAGPHGPLGLAVDISSMNTILAVDSNSVTVQAGVTFQEIESELLRRGLSLPGVYITPTIASMTVGAALMSGTGGSSLVGPSTIGPYITQAVLVDGTGKVHELTESPGLLLESSLGLLGVVTEVTLQVVAARKVAVETRESEDSQLVGDMTDMIQRTNAAAVDVTWAPTAGWYTARLWYDVPYRQADHLSGNAQNTYLQLESIKAAKIAQLILQDQGDAHDAHGRMCEVIGQIMRMQHFTHMPSSHMNDEDDIARTTYTDGQRWSASGAMTGQIDSGRLSDSIMSNDDGDMVSGGSSSGHTNQPRISQNTGSRSNSDQVSGTFADVDNASVSSSDNSISGRAWSLVSSLLRPSDSINDEYNDAAYTDSDGYIADVYPEEAQPDLDDQSSHSMHSTSSSKSKRSMDWSQMAVGWVNRMAGIRCTPDDSGRLRDDSHDTSFAGASDGGNGMSSLWNVARLTPAVVYIHAEQFAEWYDDVRQIMAQSSGCPSFVFTFRFHKASQSLLSPQYGIESVSIDMSTWSAPGLHMLVRQQALWEEIMQMTLCKYRARPDWSFSTNRMFMGACPMKDALENRLKQFQIKQRQYDPEGLFIPYMWKSILKQESGAYYEGCAITGDCFCREDSHCGGHTRCVPARVVDYVNVCSPLDGRPWTAEL